MQEQPPSDDQSVDAIVCSAIPSVPGSVRKECGICGTHIWVSPVSQMLLLVMQRTRTLCSACALEHIGEDPEALPTLWPPPDASKEFAESFGDEGVRGDAARYFLAELKRAEVAAKAKSRSGQDGAGVRIEKMINGSLGTN